MIKRAEKKRGMKFNLQIAHQDIVIRMKNTTISYKRDFHDDDPGRVLSLVKLFF